LFSLREGGCDDCKAAGVAMDNEHLAGGDEARWLATWGGWEERGLRPLAMAERIERGIARRHGVEFRHDGDGLNFGQLAGLLSG